MASIQKRGKRSFLLTVEVGYDVKGKRDRETKTIRVEDEALLKTKKKLQEYLEAELYKFKIEVESGAYIAPEKMLFSAFAEEWMEKHVKKDFSPTTVSTFESKLRIHILPVFGHKRIDQIKTIQIINFLADLSKEGSRKDGRGDKLSGRTIADIYRVIKSTFDKAAEWKIIKDNPMSTVKKPKYEQKEMNYYDEDEAERVILALEHESMMWRLFFLGAMIGGMRRGELLGLQWEDVDFDNLCIHVNNNMPVKKDGLKKPKTKSSIRTIDMPEWYMDELKSYHTKWKEAKLGLGKHWEGEDKSFVFHGGKGKPLYHTTPTTQWKRFIKKHNLKYIRLHDLRHTMVTLLIEAGTNLKAIQKRAGHSSSKVTSDTYGHITKKVSRTTAEKFDKFNPKVFVNKSSTSAENG